MEAEVKKESNTWEKTASGWYIKKINGVVKSYYVDGNVIRVKF